MDKTWLNALLVTTRLKSVFYHLKSIDGRRSYVWKILVTNEKNEQLDLLLVRLVFSRNKFLKVFWQGPIW